MNDVEPTMDAAGPTMDAAQPGWWAPPASVPARGASLPTGWPRATVLHVIAGPSHHGITRHALDLVQHGHAPHVRVAEAPGGSSRHLVQDILSAASGRGVHVHLNDTLLGDETVQVVLEVASRLPTSLTLHDLPDPREGATRYARRSRAYAALWRHSSGVVVASHHERDLLTAAALQGGADPDHFPPVWVVPLPLTPPAPVDRSPAPGGVPRHRTPTGLEPVVAVLGYVYPGKGHDQALRLAASLGLDGVLALGTTSPGHDQLVDDLRRRAEALGLTWELTGYLPDDELLARARRVALPLSWHAHASASGSIGTWLQASRRPLVADGGWVRELGARCPGTVTIVSDEQHLAAAGGAALADPSSTFLAPTTRLEPTLAQAWDATDRAIQRAHRRAPGASR